MITETTAAASTAAPAVATAATGSKATLSSDFETFLKMLTAQARYQDPLEPLDSSQYASQLAQFSMVEQQVQTNDGLAAIFAQFGLQSTATLSNWVGMEARAVTAMQFDGIPIKISPNPAAAADKAFLVVRNSLGEEVQRLEIPVSSDEVEWAGVDNLGDPFPAGRYSFDIESIQDGEKILNQKAGVYGVVREAQIFEGQVVLILQGGEAVLAENVTALRQPT